jgi:hypothetical protein
MFHRVVGTPENVEKYCKWTGRKRVGGMKSKPLPTLVPQSPESLDRSSLILPAGYEIRGSSNSGNRLPGDSGSAIAVRQTLTRTTWTRSKSTATRAMSTRPMPTRAMRTNMPRCPVELGPHQVPAAALAELLPKIGDALGQPVANSGGNTSTESGRTTELTDN